MKPSRREDEVVWRRSALALGLVLASGCGGPVGVKAPPGESSSSDGGGSPTSSAATTSEGGTDPSRPPPPPFVLPEGCGDGVIVPGQYDCFFPVPLDWVEEELGWDVAHFYPLDLEGDGRDELIALTQGQIAILRWEDGELRLEPPIDSPHGYSRSIQTRWDWNGDGRRDVTLRPADWLGTVAVHYSLGSAGLGAAVVEHRLPPENWEAGVYGNTALAVPIDVDLDGVPEVLLSMKVADVESANPAEALVLYKRTGSTWAPVGEAYPWGPCGELREIAYGDFDRDGDEDVAVLDHGQACDPFPSTYDPEWYRVGVFLSNSEEGVLELGGWYPTGGAVFEPKIWAEDVTGDGNLDLVIGISDPVWGAALIRGRGDGAFEEGKPIDLSPTFPAYGLGALSDADGDGTQEWIYPIKEGRPWAIPFDFSTEGIAPLAALNDPDEGWHTFFTAEGGDINGDGVDEYIVASSLPGSGGAAPGGTYFLMVSAP